MVTAAEPNQISEGSYPSASSNRAPVARHNIPMDSSRFRAPVMCARSEMLKKNAKKKARKICWDKKCPPLNALHSAIEMVKTENTTIGTSRCASQYAAAERGVT